MKNKKNFQNDNISGNLIYKYWSGLQEIGKRFMYSLLDKPSKPGQGAGYSLTHPQLLLYEEIPFGQQIPHSFIEVLKKKKKTPEVGKNKGVGSSFKKKYPIPKGFCLFFYPLKSSKQWRFREEQNWTNSAMTDFNILWYSVQRKGCEMREAKQPPQELQEMVLNRITEVCSFPGRRLDLSRVTETLKPQILGFVK